MSKRKLNLADIDAIDDLSDLQLLTKRCKQKWIQTVLDNQFQILNEDLEIPYNVLTNKDPQDFVICFTNDLQNSKFLNSKECILLSYEDACSWYQYEALSGYILDMKKVNNLKEKFQELIKILKTDDSVDIDSDLWNIGYRNLKLPRIVFTSDDEMDQNNIQNSYILVSKCLIQNSIPGMIGQLAKLIAQYVWNKHECIDTWRFPERNLRFL